MLVTQKKQYALRALFELARRSDQAPIKSSEIAEAQAIPPRFLEVIMAKLKRSGLVISKRGFHGGYLLARPPADISVADLFTALDEKDRPEACSACVGKSTCPFMKNCVFMPLWEEAHNAVERVFGRTSLQDLLDRDQAPS
ncbi:MAG: Rrf2 family transcriptional regulator [Desulfosarcinaceae bacterium]|nr:Rrf2 family transcriptional regulator [Desulfosarcinaceae bacterium]